MTNAERIASLVFSRATSSLTPEEEQELQQWANQSTENRLVLERWQDETMREEMVAGYRGFCEETEHTQANGVTDVALGRSKRQKIRAAIGIAATIAIIWLAAKWFWPADEKQQQPAASVSVWKQLIVEKGTQRDTTLSDGTRIWVNTSSALMYPEEFTAHQRLVVLKGEAYFEVADAARPFVVRVKNGNDTIEIRVLGTHFNVKAYHNEPLNTTVLQGKVNISSDHNPAELITAGQQLVMDSLGAVRRFNEVDTEQVMAWKDNYFDFNKTSVHDMLEEFARWYDIKVVQQDTIKEELYWRVSRSTTLPEVLHVLQKKYENLEFELHGKTLVVRVSRKN